MKRKLKAIKPPHQPWSRDRALKSGIGIVVVIAIAIIGTRLYGPSYASTYATAVESESGTVTSPAVTKSDSTASGGKYVQFQAGSTGPRHIMVFVMENLNYGDIIGSSSAPYMNSLSKSYLTATNYYGVGHYSLDNYLAMISGNFYSWSTGDCNPGSGCQVSAPTLASQLDAGGISWLGAMENMPSNCDKSNSGLYAVRHDPFPYFTNLSDCSSKVVPATNLITTLNSATPPAFVFYTPNTCNDIHDCSLSTGDKYLSSKIPAIQATTWYKNGGEIVLTFDEGDGNNQGEDLTGSGNHVLTIVISAATAGKPNYTAYVNHFGMLAGLEKAYGLSCLGDACKVSSGVLPL